jgi:hypothetical protein
MIAMVARRCRVVVARLQVEYERLRTRINAMYIDKLDGRIDTGFFERMSLESRNEQELCLRHAPLLTSRVRLPFYLASGDSENAS